MMAAGLLCLLSILNASWADDTAEADHSPACAQPVARTEACTRLPEVAPPVAPTFSAPPRLVCRDGLSGCLRELLSASTSQALWVGTQAALALSRQDADRLARSVLGNDSASVALENNPPLARAWAYLNLAVGEQGALLERDLARAEGACRQVVDLTAKGSTAAPSDVREALMCLARVGRIAPSLGDPKLLKVWPGCPCGPDGTGRLIGAACVRGVGEEPLGGVPVDERVAPGLERFIARLEQRVSPLRVTDVGLLGCGLPRPERGGDAKRAVRDRLFTERIVGTHATGASCDLSWVEFRAPGGATTRMRLYRDGQTPFADALDREARARHLDRRDPAGFYEALSQSRDEQVRLGANVRNALAETGWIVFDPTTNGAHRSHFHLQLPSSDEPADAVIRRAAGL